MGIRGEGDVEKLLSRFNITSKDLELIKKVSSLIDPDDLFKAAKEILDFLSSFDEVIEIMGYPQSESCMVTEHIARYFEELLRGTYDISYCQSRVRVGIRHDDIGVTPQLFSCAHTLWILNIENLIENIVEPDSLIPITKSLWKIASLDKTLVLDAYSTHRALKLSQEKQLVTDLNRMLRVTYAISELIMRTSDIDKLFQETVKILVREGGFVLSWIGKVDPETKEVIPVASYGLTEYLDGIFISADASIPEGRGPTGTAIRKGTLQVVNSTDSTESFLPWKERASRFGIASSVAIPLGFSKIEAVLNVYSRKKSFFSEEELNLLSVVADDLGYAMKHLAQAQAHEELLIKDVLTGLYSPSYIMEWVNWYLKKAKKHEERIIFVDFDIIGFSKINSVFGFSNGDKLLIEIGQRLKNFCGEKGKAGRITGDEFIVVMPINGDNPCFVVDELSKLIESPIFIQDTAVNISAFFGISIFPDDGLEAQDLIYRANVALLEAKRRGRSACVFYNVNFPERIKREIEIEIGIKSALQDNNLVLYLQPKINLHSQQVVGFEALIRWLHPKKGIIYPGSFIPFLEQFGLIEEVGWWVIEEALRLLKESKLFKRSQRLISFNVSIVQFENESFVPIFVEKLENSGVDPERVVIEVTESLFMQKPEEMINRIKTITERGVKVSIDDFGTGYSSLKYLKDIPASYLKIDISFIKELPYDSASVKIVKTILLLAEGLKKKTVAEGVETRQQLLFLKELGVDDVQGFYFAKPMPEEEAIRWLESYRPEAYFDKL
ncbi:MAG: EAL domain-containing protein [Syntrophobacterales bacterium]|nr:EAL domain-containing protein [Syntrophobacterales bacterium]